MLIPLADSHTFDALPLDERLVWDHSYGKWVEAKKPIIPPEPPLPLPEFAHEFLRRVRA